MRSRNSSYSNNEAIWSFVLYDIDNSSSVIRTNRQFVQVKDIEMITATDSSKRAASSIKGIDLGAIYSENVAAKVFQVAQRGLKQEAPLPTYPHTVPQEGPDAGSVYIIIERAVRYPQALDVPEHIRPQFQDQLLKIGRNWNIAINQMSSRRDTHDMGFIVQPALQKDWELTGNKESLQSVINAAYALASRYDEKVKAIRSWDVAINDRYSITDMDTNFLVIIDSMCNLDLLYYVGHNQQDQTLIDIATQHADSIIHEILRPDFSSYHLVNFDPRTGQPQAKMTNQGWRDHSTWSRGQAWSIMGFAQVYTWTKDTKYLHTAIKCAEYFLRRSREGEGKWHHPLVPLWDFDAPIDDPAAPLRDVSAAMATANGLLIIHQSLQSLPAAEASQLADPSTNFLDLALDMCSYSDDMAAAKCKLCLERGLPCSAPQLAPRKRRLPAFPQTEQHAYTNVHADRPESLDAPTAQSYAATEDFSAVSWNVSEIDMGSGDREALLLLCLHSILLMAAEELIRLATALIKPYRRERTLEKTTDALPQLINTLNTLKDAIRGVGTKIREVGSGYMSLRAHNALSACYFHSNITWGDDETSVKICKDEIAYFQQLGYGTFAYVLQISLMQQQIPMSSGELHDLASNRASFATDIDLYIYSGQITSLLQFIGHQPFTPQELLHIPAVLAAVKADGRPDYLGRSISQIMYDAAVPTSWGKDLQHSDKLGRTALHQALQKCDTTTVYLLLKLGASFGQRCLNGLSPLHISACQGHLDMVKHFLNRTKCMADVHDDFLRTPFYYAAKSSHFELMAMLAARPDVDIDAKDIHELSPLAVAARDGRAKVVKHILKLRSDKWELGVPGALN
ncbi:hypothetical protein E8E11_002286 [Didymella keratinophila]|nr:hypothetical protein E8E11_002286 [Didymella keratinophila]